MAKGVILNTLCSHSKDKDYKYERIYRILFNEELFMLAYEKIKSITPNLQGGYIYPKRTGRNVLWASPLSRIS